MAQKGMCWDGVRMLKGLTLKCGKFKSIYDIDLAAHCDSETNATDNVCVLRKMCKIRPLIFVFIYFSYT